MKFAKAVIIGLLSISFISAGIFVVIKSTAKQPDSSTVIVENTPAPETDADITDISQPSSDETSTEEQTEETATEQTEKAVLGKVEIADSSVLDTTAVTWGPGTNFNSDNQPGACVSLQEKYGHLGAIFLQDDNRIYLSFDLGYESGYTNDILDVLGETNTKAVFFMTGSYAEKQTEIVQRIIDEGHTVGNHSFSHPDMTTISDSEAAAEINKVHDILKSNYGYESYLFRFPAGTFSEKTLAIAAQNGYHSVFWSFAYNDWDNSNQPDQTQALEKTTDRLHPGAVYLLHPMETNSKILKDLITNAQQMGYQFGVL